MRILWFVNIALPDLSNKLYNKVSPYGGWLSSIVSGIIENGHSLGIVSTVDEDRNVGEFSINGVIYYTVLHSNPNKYCKKKRIDYERIIRSFEPDVIHLHGSERPQSLLVLETFYQFKIILSIQGLVSEYAKHYFKGIDKFRLFSHLNYVRLFFGKSVYSEWISMKLRGIYEVRAIERCKFISGRTDWDFAHSKNLNPSVNYFKVNESLRDGFYSAAKWDLNKCKKYTIFVSQGGYPIKGLHKLLEAVKILKTCNVVVTIRIGGANLMDLRWFKRTDYSKYLYSLLKKYDIKNQFNFLGELSEFEIIREYQSAHIFVSPSSIENSPNSVCEAQMIGTPVIASFVGGISTLVEHNVTGLLYPFDDSSLLANYISRLLNDSVLTMNYSQNGIQIATERHCRSTVVNNWLSVYKELSVDHA